MRENVYRQTGTKKLQTLQKYLEQQRGSIAFVRGKGKRKSEEQRRWEELYEHSKRWEDYENSLKTMGESRNSYSKTDPDATFMRMKDDHMRNGQLKPAYNVQIAVNSEYITGVEVFSNRTDFGTLVPFLKQMQHHHEAKYKEVTADSGYESLDNYLYLEDNGQVSFIKPANHEAQKTKKFRQKIGRIENMAYDPEEPGSLYPKFTKIQNFFTFLMRVAFPGCKKRPSQNFYILRRLLYGFCSSIVKAMVMDAPPMFVN